MEAENRDCKDVRAGLTERFEVVVRPMVATDRPLLYSSWIHSMWDQQRKLAGSVRPALWAGTPKDIFCAELHTLIDGLLNQPRVVALAACVPGFPDQVLGVAVATGGYLNQPVDRKPVVKLHWLYVRAEKPGFRRMGIGGKLMSAALLLAEAETGFFPMRLYTQHTPAMAHLALKWKLVFDPLGLQP